MFFTHPALFIGLHILVGVSVVVFGSGWPLLALFVLRSRWKWLLVVGTAALYATTATPLFDLSEPRGQWKRSTAEYIERQMEDEGAAKLVAGLVTGNFTERASVIDFQRLGLSHLMAISGFHFSLIAMFLGVCLRGRLGALMVMILLGAYLVFMGATASVVRAFVMAMVGLGGVLLERPANALNSLGVALVVVLLVDPAMCSSIGFQFSFLCTAAILTFYQPIDQWLKRWLGGYSVSQVKEMGLLDQHGFVVLVWIRRAVALTLAVHVVALPLTLYYFGTFPLLSLIYNLFFPPLVAAVMLLFPISLMTSWWGMEEALARFALDMARFVPRVLGVNIEWHLPFWGLMCYFAFVYVYSRSTLPRVRQTPLPRTDYRRGGARAAH